MDQHFVSKAESYGIHIKTLPFIEIQFRTDLSFIQEVEQLSQQKIRVVFTSVNAVESVFQQIQKEVDWKIFCIGGVTKDAVFKHFGDESIIASARSASLLSRKIIETGNIKEVIFFCGDQRLDDLPETLRANNIHVQEIIAYHNLQTPHDVQEDYDGILFFSPTAVHSFFLMNTIRTNVVLFSIGKTTTATIQSYCSNKVITSEWPGQENLLDKVLEHYLKQNLK
ncbi:MAG TPA: uroporphyrinogen-III synthase [Chitinophagaceae bacterium]